MTKTRRDRERSMMNEKRRNSKLTASFTAVSPTKYKRHCGAPPQPLIDNSCKTTKEEGHCTRTTKQSFAFSIFLSFPKNRKTKMDYWIACGSNVINVFDHRDVSAADRFPRESLLSSTRHVIIWVPVLQYSFVFSLKKL